MRFHWNAPQDKSFKDLKSALINAPALAFPDYRVPLSLNTDASVLCLGAVLMQPYILHGQKYKDHSQRDFEGSGTLCKQHLYLGQHENKRD